MVSSATSQIPKWNMKADYVKACNWDYAFHVILMAFQHTTFTGLSIVSYGLRELSEYQIR